MSTTQADTMLQNEELLLYFGTIHNKKNVSEVSRELYPEKPDSVRASISGKSADDRLLEHGFLQEKKNGSWKYKANKERLGEVIVQLLNYDDGKLPIFENADSERGKLQRMFSNKQVLRFFTTDRLSRILDEKVSNTKEMLSVYVKNITLILGGARAVISRLDVEPQALTIDSGLLKQLNSSLHFFLTLNPDRFNYTALIEIIGEIVPKLNLRQLPILRNQKPVRDMADVVENMIHNLKRAGQIEEEIDFFETPGASSTQTSLGAIS